MSKINIEHLVTELNFGLNKTRSKFKLDMAIAEHGIVGKKPFVLFLDTKDASSMKYVEYKMEDLEYTKIIPMPIDFTSLYECEGNDMVIEAELKHIMETYKIDMLPYIIQIPTDKERFNEYCDHGVKKTIVHIFERLYVNKPYEYNLDSDVDRLFSNETTMDIEKSFSELSHMHSVTDADWIRTQMAEMIIPATPKGILVLTSYYFQHTEKKFVRNNHCNFTGLKLAIVGCNSKTVGKYLVNVLPKMKATVSLYHSGSKLLPGEFKDYDVIISSVGKPGFITTEHIGTESPKLLIDVGITVVDGKVKGDFNLDTRTDNVDYTPYTKGVGLLTRLALFSNIIRTYIKYYNKKLEVI